jgi:hypothetical protein
MKRRPDLMDQTAGMAMQERVGAQTTADFGSFTEEISLWAHEAVDLELIALEECLAENRM